MAIFKKREEKDIRESFVQAIREAGLDIADRAETFVGDNTTLLSHMTITIDFDPDHGITPLISVNREFWCKKTMDRYIYELDSKEQTRADITSIDLDD